MEVQENGKRITLSKSNFIACGGEGSVYLRGGKAYKIYTDPKKMIPQGKIKELSALTLSNIIKPEGILTAKRTTTPVGYTMKYVTSTVALCPLFTKGFKKRNQITPEKTLDLVKELQEGVQHVHSKGILIVDLNETNFLVDKQFKNIFFIDVDSYQTKNYPATALMDSVKDWHANGKWTQNSDWFSWGIISFQLFVGLHPYKGRHSCLGMQERMQQHISVFNKDVSIPKVAASLDSIPQAYRDWYKAVFEDGTRAAPPIDPIAVIPINTIKPISSSVHLNITDIWSANVPIKSYHHTGSWEAAITEDGAVHYGKNRKFGRISTEIADTLFCTVDDKLIGACIDYNAITIYDMENGKPANRKIRGKAMTVCNNRLYIQQEEVILEVEAAYLAGSLTLLTKPVAGIMRNATTMFDGVAMQNMLGTWWATVFPKEGQSIQSRIPELDKHRIIDAKCKESILVIIGQKQGKYDRFIYLLHPTTRKFLLINQELDINYSGVNFTVLDNGVCVLIDENEDLLLFASTPPPNTFKKIKDKAISNNMELYSCGGEVFFLHNKELKKISMR